MLVYYKLLRVVRSSAREITNEIIGTRSASCHVSSLLNGTSAGQTSTQIVGNGISCHFLLSVFYSHGGEREGSAEETEKAATGD